MSDRAARLEELRKIYGDSSIEELEKRTELSLRFKKLISVPLGVCGLTGLVVLQLYENRLSSLPPEISRLMGLTYLDVNGNRLSSLPPEISRLTGLTYLDVRSNQLSSLPPEISRLTGLAGLHIYGNRLSSLPPEISQLTGLVYLNVSENQLSSLPPEISQLTGLMYLDVYRNPIEELPPQITALTNLKTLYIEWNGEINIKRAPRGITNLPCWNNTKKGFGMTMSYADALRKLQLYDPVRPTNPQPKPTPLPPITTPPYQAAMNPPAYVYQQGQYQHDAYYGQYNQQPYIPNPHQSSYAQSPAPAYQHPYLAATVALPNDPNSEPVTGDYADVMTVGAECVQKVGEGGFGTAYKVQLRKGVVAVKVLKKKAQPGTAEYDELTKEAKMMINLRHENIIGLYAFGCRNQEIMYVMEYADGKSIWDVIVSYGALPFDKSIIYSININAGLKYLSSQNPPVEHRDLKPENVLLCRGVAKICDFGTSSARLTVSRTTGFQGTFHYAPPEAFDAMKGYGPMSDIYTFALVIWAMLAGKRPYDSMTYGQIMSQKLHQKLPEMPPATPAKLAALMNECWNYDPRNRPSAAAIELRLTDIQKNPGAAVGEKIKSVMDMSTAELVAYLRGKKVHEDFITAIRENEATGEDFLELNEKALVAAPFSLPKFQARVILKLIDEAKRT